mgnify:CR=1 FL=1
MSDAFTCGILGHGGFHILTTILIKTLSQGVVKNHLQMGDSVRLVHVFQQTFSLSDLSQVTSPLFHSWLKIENAILNMISTHYMRRHEDVCNVWYMIQFCRKFAKIGGKKRGDNFPQSRIFLPKTIHTSSSCKVGTYFCTAMQNYLLTYFPLENVKQVVSKNLTKSVT